ncbi:MAG: hypothetical protein IJ689_04335 [Alphaproteobacteria bacterium]|nr:hypothetical protein [Alphaproteobacteria bacterium]
MNNPVYIVGNNALAYYLGAQLQSGGKRVVMLAQSSSSSHLAMADSFSVKEDRSLTQKKYKLETAFTMKEPAEMVVITAFANHLNTALSRVSRAKTGDAPIVCFTPLKDVSFLTSIFNHAPHPAFFNGYLLESKNTVSLLGRGTNITICPPPNGEIDGNLIKTFADSGLNVSASASHILSFWEYFAPYALCSLLSAYENIKISEFMKDKKRQSLMHDLVAEFCVLADSNSISLNENIVLKNVYNTPSNYVYPLHASINNGDRDEFNLITTIVAEAMSDAKARVPLIENILKELYHRVLPDIDIKLEEK